METRIHPPLQEMAQKAAKFWADFLRKNEPLKHQAAVHQEEMEFNSGLNFLGNLLRNQNPVTPDQADLFEAALTNAIMIECERGRSCFVIDVDYHPDRTLQEAAAFSGFDPEMQFPVKTTMWIEGLTVSVKEGYGAPNRQIYPVVDSPTEQEYNDIDLILHTGINVRIREREVAAIMGA